MKKLTILVIIIALLLGCSEDQCVSCIAQGKKSGIIIDHDIICDRSASYIEGFIEGFELSYKEQGDTAVINCERFTDRR